MKPILEHLATTPASADQTAFWFIGLFLLGMAFVCIINPKARE